MESGTTADPVERDEASHAAGASAENRESSLLRAALAYADRGWHVFPCKADKAPLVGNGLHQATTDYDKICAWWRRWPDALIAAACGPSGLWVVDIDPPDGEQSLAALVGARGPLRETLTAQTGRRGRHLFWQQPTGKKVRNSGSKGLASRVDVRGEGGYVILPPSVSKHGAYEWTNPGHEVVQPPAWLVHEALQANTATRECPEPESRPQSASETFEAFGRKHAAGVGGRDRRYLERALADECMLVAAAPAGQQEATLNEAALKIGRLLATYPGAMAEAEAQSALVAAGLKMTPSREPWTYKTVLRKVQHGLGDGMARPRPHRSEPQHQTKAGRDHEDPPRTGPHRPADPPAPFTLYDPTSLQGVAIPPRRWMVKGWIPLGQVTLLYGDGGLGKSLIAQQLITAAAIQKGWLGLEVTGCRAVGIFCEDDDDELARRQEAINAYYGVEFADLAEMRWSARPGTSTALWAPEGQTMLLDEIERAIGKDGFGARLVVLDTVADVFDADDLEKALIRKFLQTLARVARSLDGAIVLLAHPSVASMTAGRGTHGHVAWSNTVRARLWLTRPEPEGEESKDDVANKRTLAKMKANYGPPGEEVALVWHEGLFVPESAPILDTVDRIARHNREAECDAAFLAGLDTLTKQGRFLSHSDRAGNYAPKMIHMQVKAKGFKLGEMKAAMERLFTAGTIVANVVVGTDSYRKQIKGIARA